MRTNSSYLVTLLAFVMLACGDVSVEGPIGPEVTIESELPVERVLIEQSISDSSYDAEGRITIRDERITPTTFEILYLKVTSSSGVEYVPVELESEESEREAAMLFISEGVLFISDPDRTLLEVTISKVAERIEGATFELAVLVSIVSQ